ncbi:MAG: chromate transporter [Deltaproteobacteria bacterium 13_1_20CM_2_69_21]|nr:MAG: chromate transporter [Deltaproteobacteria bacterium 13_1_20CM_2_69_21]
MGPAATDDVVPCSMRDLLLYFLRLGTFGFGGPIALAGYMQRDLVEERRWFSKQDYMEGLALSQLSPGPLAAQLAKYLGWVRAGIPGATLVALAFIGPSFAMVLVVSWLYVRYGGLPWIQALFYGIGAAVIAIIARSAYKLARATVGKDPVLTALFAISGIITGWTEKEIIWIFFGCGFVALLARAWRPSAATLSALLVPTWLISGIRGPGLGELWRIAWYFTEAGAFVFGSGLAIVPFLHGGVVDDFHWLNERQFLDAVAVAMITPGPVVITVAFIGFLVAGLSGAVVSAVGVFLPPYLIVIFLAPYFRRWSKNAMVKAFVAGVTAAAAGAIAGAAYVLGRRSIIDVPTAVILVVVLALLIKARKIPEPVIILAAGAAGLILRHGIAR